MGSLNVDNRTIFVKDNLSILRGINTECIDLIYLDPPFNTNKAYHAPIGTSSEGASFDDKFRPDDTKENWFLDIKEKNEALYELLDFANKSQKGKLKSNYSYLCYMGIRIIEMRRILKDTGSIYLHCDQTMSHYLKLMMDCIFGAKNFRNEIIWCYDKFSNRAKYFMRNHDSILFYSKSDNYQFNKLRKENYTLKGSALQIMKQGYHILNNHKKLLVYDKEKAADKIKECEDKGFKIAYYLEGKIKYEQDWWDIDNIPAQSRSRTGWRTQKPLALIERIIKASSNGKSGGGAGRYCFGPFLWLCYYLCSS